MNQNFFVLNILSSPKIYAVLLFALLQVKCGSGIDSSEKGLDISNKGLDLSEEKVELSENTKPAFEAVKFNYSTEYFNGCEEIQKAVHDVLKKDRHQRLEFQKWYEKKRSERKKRSEKKKKSQIYYRPSGKTSMGCGSGVRYEVVEEVTEGTVTESLEPTPVGAPAPPGMGAADMGAGGTFTNVQESGVDEPDFVKISSKHIYVIRKNQIAVIDRISLNLIGTFNVPELDKYSSPRLFVASSKLIIVSSKTPDIYEDSQIQNSETVVHVYDEVAGAIPTKINTSRYIGGVRDLRLLNGKLVIVLGLELPGERSTYSKYYRYEKKNPEIPERPITQTSDDQILGIPCSSILRPVANDLDFRLSIIVVKDLNQLEKSDQKIAILGGADELYMSESNIYLAKSRISQFYRSKRSSGSETAISRISFNSIAGTLGLVSFGRVNGKVKDQWAFKEILYNGKQLLAIATTTGRGGAQQNHLWIMENIGKSMEVVASVNDFGPREDIRAVRYLNDFAYVVTFEKTDPLFAINLSNPYKPVLESELIIPGFSLYLHPVSPTLLVGIGYDATDMGSFSYFQGVQISLFDISDPKDLKRIDNKVIGARGTFTEANGNHHAFFYDPETSLMAIPIAEFSKSSQADANSSSQYGDKLEFVGAYLYRVGSSLEKVGKLTHQDLLSDIEKEWQNIQTSWWSVVSRSPDIRRIYKIDGRLITVSDFGVKAHSINDLNEELEATAFGWLTKPEENIYNYY